MILLFTLGTKTTHIYNKNIKLSNTHTYTNFQSIYLLIIISKNICLCSRFFVLFLVGMLF